MWLMSLALDRFSEINPLMARCVSDVMWYSSVYLPFSLTAGVWRGAVRCWPCGFAVILCIKFDGQRAGGSEESLCSSNGLMIENKVITAAAADGYKRSLTECWNLHPSNGPIKRPWDPELLLSITSCNSSPASQHPIHSLQTSGL